MRFVISHNDVKRELVSPFGICCSRTDLEELVEKLQAQLLQPFSYGWFDVHGHLEIASGPPSGWEE